MSNSILITGGAGFIGLHLARKLVSNGYKVDLVDNLARGIRDEDLETLLSQTSVSFTQLDLTDQKSTMVNRIDFQRLRRLYIPNSSK